MPTSTGTVATKPRKNGIFDNVDVTKRSLLFKCLRVARSHRENTAIPSTEGLSEGHCHNPLQNNGLENGYSRTSGPVQIRKLQAKSQLVCLYASSVPSDSGLVSFVPSLFGAPA